MIRIVIHISRFPVLDALRVNRPNAGTCTKNDNINVSSDVNSTTDVEENNNDSDHQEDDNLSYLLK